MAINYLMILRIAQIVFAIVTLGLTAYVTNWWINFWVVSDPEQSSTPDQTNLLLWNSVWTFLALGYLVGAPWKMPKIVNPLIVAGVEVLSFIFWFAGFVAGAVWLAERACFGDVCRVAQAAIAFSAFEAIAFGATCGLAALHAWHTVRGRHSSRSQQVPQMAQNEPA